MGGPDSTLQREQVEVAGIEPASFGLLTRLLRAQPAEGSRAVASRRHPATAPVSEISPSGPLTCPIG